MMRTIKWVLFFFFSFAISWILIITFSQDAFKMTAPVRVLIHTTRPIPIYYYITGAFVVGLLIGLCFTVYYYIALSAKLSKQRKSVASLEEEIVELKNTAALPLGADPDLMEPLPDHRTKKLEDAGMGDPRPDTP
jgi:hypothetical protein